LKTDQVHADDVAVNRRKLNLDTVSRVLGHGILDPVINICDDGQIDVAIQNVDGSVYIIKDYYFYELRVDQDLIALDNGTFLYSKFDDYPVHSRLAFSINDQHNYLYQCFVFIRVRFHLKD
jgi:hypothetical protein